MSCSMGQPERQGAVESADGLALGVQWHPENLAPEHPDHAAIFTWLVDAAAGGALLKR